MRNLCSEERRPGSGLRRRTGTDVCEETGPGPGVGGGGWPLLPPDRSGFLGNVVGEQPVVDQVGAADLRLSTLTLTELCPRF